MSPTASSTVPEHADAGVAVSVVVPVYDAMPYLETLLRSLLGQDLDPAAYEIIAVDDGSTDAGPRLLDDLAAAHPQLRVVHQENSGWPGIPRNRGLALARGRYVFFADADDEMGSEALRRLVDFADEHGSDVVVPRMVGVGRFAPHLFGQTQVDADLEVVFRTLTPQKLFRRSFLEREQIRFPEEKVRLEDGMMLARAYLLAGRVSYLGGYAFYHLTSRRDRGNISSQPVDPEGFTRSVAEVSRLVREHDQDPDRADRIVLDLYRRKCLKWYHPERWSRTSAARREQFVAAHRRFQDAHVPPALEEQLEEPFRTQSRLVRAGDVAGLTTARRAGLDQPLAAARVVRAAWRRFGGLRLVLEVHGARAGRGSRPLELTLRTRGEDSMTRVALGRPRRVDEQEGRPAVSVFEVTLPRAAVSARARTVVDLHVQVAGEQTTERVRLAAPLLSVLPAARRRARAYSTVQGNFSIQVG
ncbi:glycosyltransferase family 2 protein [Serinicoccus kebangsaanensis]|uniref:glycosyltransferase family 2 protein n=1 Tax=Serinicoccus kebangsaanensis TaxID=2602069 RepID=UPI00124D1D9C|nr:glycosyltransferase family 2 protein [Serinicoccus kebangsaanensis]